MQVYVINLKHRKDRLQHITKECNKVKLDFKLFEAINGREKYPNVEGKIMKGALGCYESHLEVLKLALQGEGHALILEDDCVFGDNFWENFTKRLCELPKDWDLFFLGGSLLWDNAIKDYSDHLKIANNVLCTQSYLVNINSIEKLIKHLEKRAYKVDVLYTEFQKENNCFISYPELTWQKAGYSDLVQMETDNQHLRYGKL